MIILPTELVDVIGVYAVEAESTGEGEKDDIRSRLRELALVSRSWLPLCRRALFSEYSLWDVGKTPEPLSRFIQLLRHPELSAYVTHVRIIPRALDQRTRWVAMLTPAAFPNTTILTLHDDGRDDLTSGLLCHLLRGFPQLRELHMPLFYGRDSWLDIPAHSFPHMAHLQTITISGMVSNVTQIIRALTPSSGHARSQLRKGTFSLNFQSDGPQYALPMFHQALQNIVEWQDISLRYFRPIWPGELNVDPDWNISLGRHRALTHLHVATRIINLAATIRGLLFTADLPSLGHLDIRLLLDWGDASIALEHELDAGPTLSDTVAQHLLSLTFYFSGHGFHHVQIDNWKDFEEKFGVLDTCTLSYKVWDEEGYLPQLQ